MTVIDAKEKAIWACKKKWGLREAQFDVLRKAARKYVEYVFQRERTDFTLYNGEVVGFGVHSTTLTSLTVGGYIVRDVFREEETARQALDLQAHDLIELAFATCRVQMPFLYIETEVGGTALPAWRSAWRSVYSRLQAADLLVKHRDVRCTKITDKGREAAADWKQAIGAEEE